MLISRISLPISNGTVGRPPRAFDFQRQYKRKPARCHLTTVSGLTIASASPTRTKPIEASKNQAVNGGEGLFLGSGSPQNVYLLPQHPNFCLKRRPRPDQIDDHPTNEPDKISHHATASPDSRSTASQIGFATGTGEGVFFAAQSSADCVTNISGFDLRQAQVVSASGSPQVPPGGLLSTRERWLEKSGP